MKVIVGSSNELNYMSGMGINNDTLGYFRDNYQKVSNYLGNTASAFSSSVKNIFTEHLSADAIDRAKRAISKLDLGAGFNDNVIHYVSDPRLANGVMLNYIMANPRVDDLFRRNVIDGYSSTTYQHSGIPLEHRPEYQQVIDGVIDDDGSFEFYFDTDNTWLSLHEQQAVRRTWDEVSLLLNNDEDPTASNL